MPKLEWSTPKFAPKVNETGKPRDPPSTNLEMFDLLGTKTIDFPDKTRKVSNPRYALKPFQMLLLESNYSLASNQGLKHFNKETTLLPSYSSLVVGPLIRIVTPEQVEINHGSMAAALFWSSLPDIRSEVSDAYDTKKYWKIPSGVITALVNAPLFLFHAVTQSVQGLCQILSLPTMLNRVALRDFDNAVTRGQKVTAGFLFVISAIITSPFQLFNIISNTIGYVRHVVDGAATFAKAALNTIVDGIAGLIKWGVSSDKEGPQPLIDSFKKNVSQMQYALTNTIKNAWRLIPVAAAAAVAFFTAGVSLAATSAAATIGVTSPIVVAVVEVTLIANMSQALSMIRIGIGDAANYLADKVSEGFKSLTSTMEKWLNKNSNETSKDKGVDKEMQVSPALAGLGTSGKLTDTRERSYSQCEDYEDYEERDSFMEEVFRKAPPQTATHTSANLTDPDLNKEASLPQTAHLTDPDLDEEEQDRLMEDIFQEASPPQTATHTSANLTDPDLDEDVADEADEAAHGSLRPS